MHIKTKQCKLFPIAAPHFTVLNSIDEIKQMLDGVFVVEEVIKDLAPYETLIGTTSESNDYFIKDDFIWGSIEVGFKDGEDDCEFEWVNASAKVDFGLDNDFEYGDSGRIISIDEILVKRVYK